MMMQNLRYYILAVFTETFIVQVHFWELADEWLKRVSIVAGIAVAVFTVIKFYQDISNKNLDNRIKRLDIKKKEEEVRRFFQQKYSEK
jgi:hypothetical protein